MQERGAVYWRVNPEEQGMMEVAPMAYRDQFVSLRCRGKEEGGAVMGLRKGNICFFVQVGTKCELMSAFSRRYCIVSCLDLIL